jgi:branched-chain amino acid transport system ATP-binding protein
VATILSVENLVVSYGAVEALKGISLELGERDIIAVLGANGAGKTTLLKAVSRLLNPKGGTIRLKGEDITRFQPHQLICHGVAHVPEGRHVFATLTVEENLKMGAYGVRSMPAGKEFHKTRDWVF